MRALKVIHKDNDNLDNGKYNQKPYVDVKRTKRGAFDVGKFRYRSRTRQAKKVIYRIKVKIRATTSKGKRGIYTGTSHNMKFFKSSVFKKEYNNALAQAKAYAIQDLFGRWLIHYDDMLHVKVISVKVLRTRFK